MQVQDWSSSDEEDGEGGDFYELDMGLEEGKAGAPVLQVSNEERRIEEDRKEGGEAEKLRKVKKERRIGKKGERFKGRNGGRQRERK